MDTAAHPKLLIVGAGPVGLCLACELARYGVGFRIIDKRPLPSKTSKALGIHARSLEMLYDMGLAERFIERGLPVSETNIYSDGKRLATIKLSDVDSPFNFTLDLPQSQTEALLIEHLAELGHEVERYIELESIEQTADGVEVSLKKKGGVLERSTYDYVVGCDGAHSTVREQLGIPFEGESYPEDFVLADVKLASPLAPNAMHMFFHPDGALALFPMRDSRVRIIAEIASSPGMELNETYVQGVIDKRAKLQSHVSDGVWFSQFRIHRRMVPRYRDGRVFLAGDAAHIHSPAGGQGMNTGMQDAYNLAWKLGLKLKGGPDLLNSYSPERHAVGKHVVELTDRMTRVVTMKNPVATAIRDAVAPFIASFGVVQHKVAESLEEVDVNYRKSPIVGEYLGTDAPNATRAPFLNGPRAGERAPDATVTDIREGRPATLFSLFQGTHFTLLLFTHANAKEDESSAAEAIATACTARLGDWLKCVFISDRQAPEALRDRHDVYLDARLSAHKAYGVAKARALYLIRPDGYIAFRSTPVNTEALETFLTKLGFAEHDG
ncbi:MAG: FAD-dependent monooxygenase [Puniceicoccales bacterium]